MNWIGIRNMIQHLLVVNKKKGESFIPYVKRFKILGTAFDFWVFDETGQQWYDHDFWDQAIEFQMLNKMINNQSHVIEFGLHHGFNSTLISKKVGIEGKYIGVELLPIASVYCMANLNLNGLGPNCKIINAAGGNKNDEVSFSNEANANGFIKSNDKGVKIRQIMGDELLKEVNNRVDVLKIDVEGYEINVLEGCKNILAQYPHIDLEIHPESIEIYGNKVLRIFELIDLEKYNAFYFWNSGTKYIDPTSHVAESFTTDKLRKSGILNLFLFSKEKA